MKHLTMPEGDFCSEVSLEEFVAVLPESKLADNEPTRAIHNGVPILLVRREERLFAVTLSYRARQLPRRRPQIPTQGSPWPLSFLSFASRKSGITSCSPARAGGSRDLAGTRNGIQSLAVPR